MLRSAAIALCLLVAGVAHSQEPTPAPAKQRQPPQQQPSAPAQSAERDDRGTKRSPLIVEQLESESDAAEKKAGAQHRKDEAARNWWLVVFTGGMLLVAVLQALAFMWQLAMTRRAVRDAGAAAKAADASARVAADSVRAFQLAQRAWIAVEQIKVTGVAPPDGFHHVGAAFQIPWRNAGESPAIRCRTWSQVRTVAIGEPIPHFVPGENNNPEEVWVPDSRTFGRYVYVADLSAWRAGTELIYIYGRVEYEDMFHAGVQRHTETMQVVSRLAARGDDGGEQDMYSFTPVGPQNGAS